ncbi:MAG TPA: hypothetical protein ACFCUD_07375 [Cyclobacteriaceae bacterium]
MRIIIFFKSNKHYLLLLAIGLSSYCASKTNSSTSVNNGQEYLSLEEIESLFQKEYGTMTQKIMSPDKSKILFFVGDPKGSSAELTHFIIMNLHGEKKYENKVNGSVSWYDDDQIKIIEPLGIINKKGNSSRTILINVNTKEQHILNSTINK